MLHNKKTKLGIYDFNQKITLMEGKEDYDECKIVYKPLSSVWAFIDFIGLKDRDCDKDVPHYQVIFIKNKLIESRLHKISCINWRYRVLHLLHFLPDYSSFEYSNTRQQASINKEQ